MEVMCKQICMRNLVYADNNARTSQKFCNICIDASFQNKIQELEGAEMMPHTQHIVCT